MLQLSSLIALQRRSLEGVSIRGYGSWLFNLARLNQVASVAFSGFAASRAFLAAVRVTDG